MGEQVNTPLETENLFLAGKSYAVAARELCNTLSTRPTMQLPISFLAAFSFELTIKAALRAAGTNDSELRSFRHDLRAAFRALISRGYRPPAGKKIEAVIEVIADAHEQLLYRYIPDVEEVQTARPDVLVNALLAHIEAIEQQFDVWPTTLPRSPAES